MTAWGGRTVRNIFFLSPVDSILIRFIFPFVLPHREGRSRSSRSRGGMRWTPEMRRHAVHGGRLSSGRTDLRQHCHWQGDGRPWDGKTLDSVTDDQVKTRSAYSLEAPFPSPWDFNSRSERSSRQSASNRKNTAGGTSGTCSAPPKVLMHSQLRKTASHQAQGCNGHPAFRTPSHKGRECKQRRRPRAANNGGDDACLKGRGCLTN